MLWWSFFLAKARTLTEAYRWITSVTRTWSAAGEKTAANTACEWIRAACTQSLEAVTSSSVAINVRPAPRDAQVMQWASHSLNLYLPCPKPVPSNQQQTATVVQPQPDNHSATLHQAMVLAQDVIKSAVECSNRERTVAKRLLDTILCRLLGLSSLGWEDQSLLAPVWLTLHQQPDKASKAMVLRTFFQDLGKQVPAFSQFRNSMLFEHITGHKFEPGAGFDTCHHGISLLAVSMRSFSAQERERQDDDDFKQATNKTPEAMGKHSAKAPPPLPTTVAELLQSMWRLIVLTTGLFTTHCSFAVQLKDLHTAVQERKQTIMGDPEAVADLIPQLVWAVTTAAPFLWNH
jgi:hypothetical protein